MECWKFISDADLRVSGILTPSLEVDLYVQTYSDIRNHWVIGGSVKSVSDKYMIECYVSDYSASGPELADA